MLFKVLLIESNEIKRKMFEDSFYNSFNFVYANDCADAYEIISKQYRVIKLILADIDACRFDNYRLLSNLASNTSLGAIPVICYLENTLDTNKKDNFFKEALEHGAVDVFSYPFDPQAVSIRMNNLIRVVNNSSFLNITSGQNALKRYDEVTNKGTFWNPKSIDSVILHTYVGAACIIESFGDNLSVIQANKAFVKEIFTDERTTYESLTMKINEHIDDLCLVKLRETMDKAIKSADEESCELLLKEVHSKRTNIHILVSLKLLDHVNDRSLFYCTVSNDTGRYEAQIREHALTEQLSEIIKNVESGVAAISFDKGKMKCLYSNDNLYTLFGFTKEEFTREIGHSFHSLVLPEYVDIAYDAIKSVPIDKKPRQIEFKVKKRDDSIIWVRLNVSLSTLENKSEVVIILVFRDITLEKDALEQINVLNRKLGDSEIILNLDITNKRIIDFYSKYESCSNYNDVKNNGAGFERRAINNIYPDDLIVVKDLFSYDGLAERFSNGDTKFYVEYRRKTKTEQYRWFCATTVFIQNVSTGSLTAIVYSKDIDDEKKDKLARDTIVDKYIDTIAIINIKTGKARLVKKTEFSLVNIGEEFDYQECVNEMMHLHIAEEDILRAKKFFSIKNLVSTIEKEGIASLSFWIIDNNGNNVRKNSRVTYLDSTHEDLLMVGRDITALFEKERKQQLLLREALERADEANKAKSDFLSRMSHDMRTPLTAILGLTELAANENTNSEIQSYLNSITISGHHLLGLINDTLDLTKIESGKLQLNQKAYPVSEFLDGLNTVIRPLMDEKNIDFKLDFGCAIDNIIVDKLRFNQIFFNLLSNAAKFTPNGGKVEVTEELIPGKDGKVGMRFHVKDNGIGMSEAYQKILFDPFTQEDRPELAERRGTGLGLAIVKQIIDTTDGKIEVHSELGKGTEFIIDLYAYNLATTDIEEVSLKYNPDDLVGLRVLSIDDTELNNIIISKILNRKGCIVETANGGLEGVRMFSSSEPKYFNIVFTDLRMPVVDGFEVTRMIRNLDRVDAKTIPIVALTADVYSDDEDKTSKSSMNGRLVKPIDTDKMCEMIIKLVKDK